MNEYGSTQLNALKLKIQADISVGCVYNSSNKTFSYLQPDSKQSYTYGFDYKTAFVDIKETEQSSSNATTINIEENDQNLDNASDITVLPITKLSSTSEAVYYAASFPCVIYSKTGNELSCFAKTPRFNSNVKFGLLSVTIHSLLKESSQTSDAIFYVTYFFDDSTSSVKMEHILMLDVMRILNLSLNDFMQMICEWDISCYTECLNVTTLLGHQKHSGTFLTNSMLLCEFIDYFFKKYCEKFYKVYGQQYLRYITTKRIV